MAAIRIVQQPGIANVVLVEDAGTTPALRGRVCRLYQHTRERCEGYLCGYIDGLATAPELLPPVRCMPGELMRLNWFSEGKNPSPTFSPKEPELWLNCPHALPGESP